MKGALKSELTIPDVLGHFIVWILLAIVTLGLAMFVYPYYLFRFVISKTSVYDAAGKKVGMLTCNIDLTNAIGNIVIWLLLIIVTLGIAYFAFMYKVLAYCINKTTIEPLAPGQVS